MNVLLFYPDECPAFDYVVTLLGKRCEYVIDRHQITSVGVSIKAGIVGGPLGRATLLSVSAEAAQFRFTAAPELYQLPPRSPAEIIVGVPRPQTVKKVVQVAVSFGIRAVHFVAFEKTVKSYLMSKVWSQDSLQFELLEALEQSGDTVAPIVALFNDMQELRAKMPSTFERSQQKFVFDQYGQQATCSLLPLSPQGGIEEPGPLFLFGPEAGLTETERETLFKAGYTPLALGARMLRSEHAVCAALAIFSSRLTKNS